MYWRQKKRGEMKGRIDRRETGVTIRTSLKRTRPGPTHLHLSYPRLPLPTTPGPKFSPGRSIKIWLELLLIFLLSRVFILASSI